MSSAEEVVKESEKEWAAARPFLGEKTKGRRSLRVFCFDWGDFFEWFF